MIRKPTIVLLVIFAALVGLAFFLQKNPLPAAGSTTPTPTTVAALLDGWAVQDIVWIQLANGEDQPVQVTQKEPGIWVMGDGKSASAGIVEQVRSQIIDLRPLAILTASTDLNAAGLNAPAHILSIRNTEGQQAEIKVGILTPTNSGYYVQVDDRLPVVVNNNSIDSILETFTGVKLFEETANPATDLQQTKTP